ncbi:HEPN domain-containing protein [Leptospira meyeri]|uniref:HEPN domain-containing protein n=1 Tax=Leptospira meyeri TaxID=29508 RepID=UPI00108321BB|nr:HEPN domain-containing protein [Leptospira meyeri]TGM60107.1 hypothetical protein EHQ93_18015 [Leptospira meyeri]
MNREENIYTGIWYIKRKKVSGTLIFSKITGIHLEITSEKKIEIPENKIRYIPGITNKNQNITLFNNELLYGSIKTEHKTYYTYRFSSSYILEDSFYNNQKKILKFDYISVYFESTNKWLNRNTFETKLKKNKEHITITEMKPISLKLKNIDSEISIFNSIGYNFKDNQTFSYESKFGFEIKPTSSKELDWFLSKVYDLQNFLLLISDFYFPVIKLRGKGEINENSINIIYLQINNKTEKQIHQNDILFPYQTISKKITKIANSWFIISEKIRPTIDLLFASIVNNSEYQNFTFLALTQALENLHRILYSNQRYYPDKEFDIIKKSIMDNLPKELKSDYKSSLTNRIKYSNEFSLRKRLKNLFTDLSSDLQSLVFQNDLEMNILINTLVDTRNYYTHYSKEPESKIISYLDLYKINKFLIILIKMLLLKQIGFSDKEIFESLKTKRRLKPFFLPTRRTNN